MQRRTILLGGAGTLALGAIALPALLGDPPSAPPAGSGSGVQAAGVCTPDGSGGGGLREDAIPNKDWLGPIYAAAKTSGLSPAIIAAQIKQESGWNPKAISPVGARGLTQFMPGTWDSYGKGKDPFDPLAAIDAQGRYLAVLAKEVSKVPGDKTKLVLAAYNSGPGNVRKYNGVPPFRETQNYVELIPTSAQKNFSADCAPADIELAGNIEPGKWVHPLKGSKIRSPFGPRPCPFGPGQCGGVEGLLKHMGLDLAGGGTQFVAPTAMTITYVGTGDKLFYAYGNYIFAVQDAAPHYVFEFHHAAPGSIKVQVGQKVAAGTVLGTVGATGNATGAHLHFQIDAPGTKPVNAPAIHNKTAIDPRPILKKAGVL